MKPNAYFTYLCFEYEGLSMKEHEVKKVIFYFGHSILPDNCQVAAANLSVFILQL